MKRRRLFLRLRSLLRSLQGRIDVRSADQSATPPHLDEAIHALLRQEKAREGQSHEEER